MNRLCSMLTARSLRRCRRLHTSRRLSLQLLVLAGAIAIRQAAFCEVIGAELHSHLVAHHDLDPVLTNLARQVRHDGHAVLELDLEHTVAQVLADIACMSTDN